MEFGIHRGLQIARNGYIIPISYNINRIFILTLIVNDIYTYIK